jgi:hypothetical protein
LILHINDIIYSVFVILCLANFSCIMSSIFIYAIRNGRISFYFVAEWYSIVWLI